MNTQLDESKTAAASFCAAAKGTYDGFLQNKWMESDWNELFAFTTIRRIKSGEALVQSGESDRTLFFILSGTLEVLVQCPDGLTLGQLTRISAGSVVGEQSFFDGERRSASVWAVEDCGAAAMTPDQFRSFETHHPALARDLLFGLACILARRLRTTTKKVFG